MVTVSGKFELANPGESFTLAEMDVEVIDLKFQGVEGGIASFLVRGPDGWILVETGPESTRGTLLESLAARGIAPGDLKAVFVTHIHLDHAGASGWFAQQGVPVHVHPRGARHLVDPGRLVESARSVYGERFDPLWGGMPAAPAESVRPIADGATVSVAGLSVTALDTPGHAFHHHAYLIGGDCFAGDAAGARLADSDYLSATSAPPQFHLEMTLSSLDRIAAVAPERLFLTHFGPVSDVSAHLRDYRDAVGLNAEFVRQRMAEGLDAEALAVAYEAFQLQQAQRLGLSAERWRDYQAINGTGMCATGIRMYWEARLAEERQAKES
ncbi:MAG TPA: MBL fold metallo-hydrolase [Bacteroidia bacterium]|nr:MBL fold metallo-hydrolase [Bacteroidia bacterium]